MSDALMPIGRFASLCRLSVKQLRHYDDIGLLAPSWVDRDSGYRYYRADQARDALSIGLLRSLDVPLPAIGQVLAGQGVADVLSGVRDRMEADLARRRRMLHTLDRVLSDGLPQAEVQLIRQDASKVVVTRGAGELAEVAAVTSDCVGRLVAALEAARARLTGPLVALFPLDLADTLTTGRRSPCPGPSGGGTCSCGYPSRSSRRGWSRVRQATGLPGAARVQLVTFTEGTCVQVMHHGSFDDEPQTPAKVGGFMAERGLVHNGLHHEIYLSDFSNPATMRTILPAGACSLTVNDEIRPPAKSIVMMPATIACGTADGVPLTQPAPVPRSTLPLSKCCPRTGILRDATQTDQTIT